VYVLPDGEFLRIAVDTVHAYFLVSGFMETTLSKDGFCGIKSGIPVFRPKCRFLLGIVKPWIYVRFSSHSMAPDYFCIAPANSGTSEISCHSWGIPRINNAQSNCAALTGKRSPL
jgi:hypothetical protein